MYLSEVQQSPYCPNTGWSTYLTGMFVWYMLIRLRKARYTDIILNYTVQVLVGNVHRPQRLQLPLAVPEPTGGLVSPPELAGLLSLIPALSPEPAKGLASPSVSQARSLSHTLTEHSI